MTSSQTPNPRFPGAPARMADGRLFTNYRQNGSLLAPLGKQPFADWERHQLMKNTGEIAIKSDRGQTVMAAAAYGCVDTMVPELQKRVYAWNGPILLPCQSTGIGTGQSYLPGRLELVSGDPDVLAAATFPEMAGTFSTNMGLYIAGPQRPPMPDTPVAGRVNRYSPPYGNQ